MSDRADPSLGSLLARVDDLIRRIEASADRSVRGDAKALVNALLQFHRAGLERMLSMAQGCGEPGRLLASAYASDALVASLLMLHELHPVPLVERVSEALEAVTPKLRSLGGEATLEGLEGGTARVRLEGPAAARAAMRLTVEEALGRAAADLESIQFEELEGRQPAGRDQLVNIRFPGRDRSEREPASVQAKPRKP
jgi:Fe-S cluster biogenesis protein NfuA